MEFLYDGEARQGESITDMVCVYPFLEMITSFGLSEAGPAWRGDSAFIAEIHTFIVQLGFLFLGLLLLKSGLVGKQE